LFKSSEAKMLSFQLSLGSETKALSSLAI